MDYKKFLSAKVKARIGLEEPREPVEVLRLEFRDNENCLRCMSFTSDHQVFCRSDDLKNGKSTGWRARPGQDRWDNFDRLIQAAAKVSRMGGLVLWNPEYEPGICELTQRVNFN